MSIDFNPGRREFLKRAVLASASVAIGQRLPEQSSAEAGPKFSSSELGVNINPGRLQWMNWQGVPMKDTLGEMLDLPFQHVRIPIPFNMVYRSDERFDFSRTDPFIFQALEKGKVIALQMGVKTIGYPEVHVPRAFYDRFPHLDKPGPVDSDPALRQIIKNYLQATAEHYLPKLPEASISSIHVENEAFVTMLDLARYRYVSPGFNEEEVALVRSLDPYDRPIIQNFPDTIEAVPHVIKNTDIVGFNFYNQSHYNFQWSVSNALASMARALGKRIKVTEYQFAPWVDSKMQPVHPFNAQVATRDLLKVKSFNPEVVYLWDLEQYSWHRKMGEELEAPRIEDYMDDAA